MSSCKSTIVSGSVVGDGAVDAETSPGAIRDSSVCRDASDTSGSGGVTTGSMGASGA